MTSSGMEPHGPVDFVLIEFPGDHLQAEQSREREEKEDQVHATVQAVAAAPDGDE